MTRQELYPSVLASLEKRVLSYNFKDWDTGTWTLQAGTRHRSLPTTVLKKWPTRVVVALHSEESDYNSEKNPFYFQHCNVRDLVIDISGTKYAYHGLTWDFTGKDYNAARVYFENAVRSGATGDYPFSYHDFLKIYSIFVFDVTNTRCFLNFTKKLNIF